MRIIVISDTHENYKALESVLLRNQNADACIHLGDGEYEANQFLSCHPEWNGKFFYIKGNCDYGSVHPYFLTLDIVPGHRIFATHGHRYAVKYGHEALIQIAKENDCDIALYGHTHVRCATYEENLYILNPGSASRPRDGFAPSYAFLDITKAGVVTNHVSL